MKVALKMWIKETEKKSSLSQNYFDVVIIFKVITMLSLLFDPRKIRF